MGEESGENEEGRWNSIDITRVCSPMAKGDSKILVYSAKRPCTACNAYIIPVKIKTVKKSIGRWPTLNAPALM